MMKSKFVWMILFLVLVLPVGVGATSIRDVVIPSTVSPDVGSRFYLPIEIHFSDLDATSNETSGIYTVSFEFEFDDTVFDITNIITDGYESVVLKYDNKYYVTSVVDEHDERNKCVDDFLMCTDYSAKIEFYVKNRNRESVDVKFTKAEVGVFKMDPTYASYNMNKASYLNFQQDVVRTIYIKNTGSISTDQVVESVVVEQAPGTYDSTLEKAKENVITKQPSSTPNVDQGSLSSNTRLSFLSVDNYEIDFKSDVYSYELLLPKEVSSLVVNAKTEDVKATYQVIGADDLKDEVKVIVSAEDQTMLTYTIRIKREEDKGVISEKGKFPKNVNKIVLFVGCGVVSICLISFIISRIHNRRMNKMLDRL